MYLHNSYSLLHTVDRQRPERADSQAIIQQWHGRRIRRIDHYIQLCLAGALACVEQRQLPANTCVYLSTRCGTVTTSAEVMRTIEAEGELPKPLHFVNTLGNSAGFYLTQTLQLTGTALVLSAEQFSFDAALTHALIDLSAGYCEYALVGAFDEAPLPVEHQLQRLGAAPDAPYLFEGSHWLLLGKSPLSTTDNKCPSIALPKYIDNLGELSAEVDPKVTQLLLAFLPTEEEKRQLEPYSYDVFCKQELSLGTVPHGAFSGASTVAAVNAVESNKQPVASVHRGVSGDYAIVCIS